VSIFERVTNRLRVSYFRGQFNRAAAEVLKTKPLTRGVRPFIALSMVQHRDVVPYLIAIKSFAHFVPPERVVVVCDPSITNEDRVTFKRHIPHVELRDAVEFRHPKIPTGGCWERLSAISQYSSSGYVIQLDADTVTTSPLPEVFDAVKERTGFVLGEERDQKPMTLLGTAFNAKEWSDQHVQAVAEKSMAQVLRQDALYIRGCAGFTGFPSSLTLREELLHFSQSMWSHIGSRWSEWGTEQVASNYLVANSAGVSILPFPKYSTPYEVNEHIAFHHYIGHVRYKNSKYAKAAKAAISFM
jgi:hypothetical protein